MCKQNKIKTWMSLWGNWTPIFYFTQKTLPNIVQIACKKQSNVQKNNKPPQPHKIEAQETKNL
jgi:hypothetical protein